MNSELKRCFLEFTLQQMKRNMPQLSPDELHRLATIEVEKRMVKYVNAWKAKKETLSSAA